jgi:penicillin-binding protein-related factor A (putative recombinase)
MLLLHCLSRLPEKNVASHQFQTVMMACNTHSTIRFQIILFVARNEFLSIWQKKMGVSND